MATGPVPTPTVPTFTNLDTSSTISIGNGWANAADRTMTAVPLSGSTYPDNWNALSAAIPAYT
jgi:glucan 1,3-beta-glucosidase